MRSTSEGSTGFLTYHLSGILNVHARITTEKGAALDTFYLRDPDAGHLTDPKRLATLQDALDQIIGAREAE